MPKKKTSHRKRAQKPIGPIRLQRFLAQAGLGSRRECEELILEARVQIDGNTASELGVRVDPDKQKVRVDGNLVKPNRSEYFAVNKPAGVVSTCSDPAGRMRVIDLIKTDQRVYNVGRLDKSSEGLILVTNDGELANRLTHPRYGVEKTYLVTVAGRPSTEELSKLRKGVYLAEGKAKVTSVRIKRRGKLQSDLIIILDEGRNREIRRLLAHVGHKVQKLKRIAIGPLKLGDLPPGAHRKLEPHEIDSLMRFRTGDKAARKKSAGKSDNRKSPTSQSPRGKKPNKRSTKKNSTSRPGSRTGSRADGRSGTRKKAASKSSASGGRSVKRKSAKPLRGKAKSPRKKSRR